MKIKINNMNMYKNKFVFGVLIFICLTANVFSQATIKFLDQPCSENCNALKSLSSFKNQACFINFSIEGISKIELKPSEILMVKFKFFEESSSFEEFSVLAKQNEKGIITGESILMPNATDTDLKVNTIYKNEFNFRLLEKLKSLAGSSLKLHIEKYSIFVYDIVKKRFVTMDFGVQQEDMARFKQFINVGTSYDLNKYPTLKLQYDAAYPYDEMSKKVESAIQEKSEILYNDLTTVTSAPKEYTTNDFNGISGEVTREDASKILHDYFKKSNYSVSKISQKSNQAFIEKESNGTPKYKWFYLLVLLRDNSGKCGYAPVTMKADYQGAGKYSNWRVDVYKWTTCPCN